MHASKQKPDCGATSKSCLVDDLKKSVVGKCGTRFSWACLHERIDNPSDKGLTECADAAVDINLSVGHHKLMVNTSTAGNEARLQTGVGDDNTGQRVIEVFCSAS